MRLKIRLLFVALGFLLLISCRSSKSDAIRAKGPVVEKNFEFGKNYTRIEVRNGWKVRLIHSPRMKTVVRTQKNIMDYVAPKVLNEKLVIDFNSGISIENIQTQTVDVYYRDLDEITVSEGAEIVGDDPFEQRNLTLTALSGGSIKLDQLKVGKTEVKADQEATVELSGTSVDFIAEVTKYSKLKAQSLKAITANLKAYTAGEIYIDVLDEVTADANTGATIQYYGEPVYIDASQK